MRDIMVHAFKSRVIYLFLHLYVVHEFGRVAVRVGSLNSHILFETFLSQDLFGKLCILLGKSLHLSISQLA